MARRLFFVESVRRGTAELTGEGARHLTRVLRVEPGQRYEISDNQSLFLAEIQTVRKDRVVFRVLEELAIEAQPFRVTLAAALIRFERFEWMVEKATELGVETIIPVQAERCEKGLERAAGKRPARWRRIALEASQQCRRPRLPAIEPPRPFAQALEIAASRRYLLDETPGGAPIPPATEDTAVLAGPEGGWTDVERRRAVEAGWIQVSLGPLVLRTETAALAALAVLKSSSPWTHSLEGNSS